MEGMDVIRKSLAVVAALLVISVLLLVGGCKQPAQQSNAATPETAAATDTPNQPDPALQGHYTPEELASTLANAIKKSKESRGELVPVGRFFPPEQALPKTEYTSVSELVRDLRDAKAFGLGVLSDGSEIGDQASTAFCFTDNNYRGGPVVAWPHKVNLRGIGPIRIFRADSYVTDLPIAGAGDYGLSVLTYPGSLRVIVFRDNPKGFRPWEPTYAVDVEGTKTELPWPTADGPHGLGVLYPTFNDWKTDTKQALYDSVVNEASNFDIPEEVVLDLPVKVWGGDWPVTPKDAERYEGGMTRLADVEDMAAMKSQPVPFSNLVSLKKGQTVDVTVTLSNGEVIAAKAGNLYHYDVGNRKHGVWVTVIGRRDMIAETRIGLSIQGYSHGTIKQVNDQKAGQGLKVDLIPDKK